MPAQDPRTEESNVGANRPPGEPGGSGPPADTTLPSNPRRAPGQPRSRVRLALLVTLLAAAAAWLAYDSAQQTPAARTPAESVALDAAGGWWSVLGDRYLELEWEGRRATLWDYATSDSGVESTGSWRTTDRTVFVQVSGAAGSLAQEYEVVGNDAELFLAPAPVSTARLLDSWIADHGSEDDEDVGPGPSVSREAAWRPHHARHPRHMRPPRAQPGA